MSGYQRAVKPLSRCLQSTQPQFYARTFSSSATNRNEASTKSFEEELARKPQWNPEVVSSRRGEKALMAHGILPIGSRRRRAAIQSSPNIPFEQLPYQCFQEARAVLQADREQKLKEIATERARIDKLAAQDASTVPGGELQKKNRLESMRKYLERLKLLADINDPMIKKRFEDGEGDMNKPIYRHLAQKKWASYQKLIIEQRISQLNIVPDTLAHFSPTAEVKLAFGRRNVQPGEFVDSRVSEIAPRLRVQVFDKGERLVSVVVVDTDVPVPENDWFTSRCHFAACNVPIAPTQTSLPLSKVDASSQLVLPWLPAFAQKGTPYHRYSVFVLEQKPGQVFDVEALREGVQRDGFNIRGFVDRHGATPIGLGLFRSTWDEGTKGVMERHNIPGADVEFKRIRVAALKPKQKARGWEARHASDKYKSLRR
ncbi:hypothetical protein V496_01900 [Pseudogymnoascus sp. VKM F-4515 (FW-2607)]|nr:hypothetical protein V496_01900 [Pseudogymnoascus sp. VKM F-4515 (FW-2607)]